MFNCGQIDGYELPAAMPLPETARIPHAEAFIAALDIPATLDADPAYYRIDFDRICMPAFETFKDAESFYATLAHETTHNAADRIIPSCMR